MPLVIAGFGVWYALARGRRREGDDRGGERRLDAVAVTLVIPHSAARQTPFVGRYSEARRRRRLQPPVDAVRASRSSTSASRYLLDARTAAGGLCLLAPIALAARASARVEPSLGGAGAVVDPLPLHGRDHPAARRRRRARRRARPRARAARRSPSIALAAALIGNYFLGAIPLWNELPHGESLQSRAAVVTEHDRVAAQALALIPPHASGQRDELARRTSLRALARAQLPVHPGREVDRRRRDAARLRRPARAAADGGAGRLASAQPCVAARVRTRRRARLPPRAAALERNRLSQEVCADHERQQRRRLVVLRRGERDGPDDVPDDEVRQREQQRARREAEARAAVPRLAREPRVRDEEREREQGDRGSVRDSELLEPVRAATNSSRDSRSVRADRTRAASVP